MKHINDKLFVAGVTPVLTSGAVMGEEEKAAMHKAVDAGWITGGDNVKNFEQALAEYTGRRAALTCNSGSSANLIAVATMVEAGLWKEGDHIMCLAASFPTTINPLLLYGLVPVFVDITLPDFGVDMGQMNEMYTERVKGVMIAHTLGIPYNLDLMAEFCAEKGLTVVEDCCDALGTLWGWEHVGSLGVLSTTSFYPAHHITTGEGGAVFTDNLKLAATAKSIRDWGRSCYCDPGQENACKKRFNWKLGDLPYGFDHKYTYSTLGFNLKLPEVSAALGVVQLSRIKDFTAARVQNFELLYSLLSGSRDFDLVGCLPDKAMPSWFGFPLLLNNADKRRALQVYLDKHKIGSRLVFGGNLTKQPYMKGRKFWMAQDLSNTDFLMTNALWVGVYPGLCEQSVRYMAAKILDFFEGYRDEGTEVHVE